MGMWRASIVIMCCGCADPPEVGPPPPVPVCECTNNRDCPNAGICLITSSAACGVCHRVYCTNDDDGACDEAEVCDIERGMCERADACRALAPSTGCEAPELCAPSASDERCVAPEPTSCVVVPHTLYVHDGAARPAVDVVGIGPRGRPEPFDAALIETDSALSAGDGTVTCSAPIVRLSALSSSAARVVARDADTGAAIAGAIVRIEGATGDTSPDGLFVAEDLPAVPCVRVDKVGYETVAILSPPRDVEVLLPRATAAEKIGGAELTVDATTVTFAEVRYNVASLSFSNLVDDVTHQNLFGPVIPRRFDANVTLHSPTSTMVFIGAVPIFSRAVVVGRPGPRVLSFVGGSAMVYEAQPAYVAGDEGEHPYEGILTLWEAGAGYNHLDIAGTTEVIEAEPPADEVDLERFAPDGAPLVAGHEHEATDEIDVIMPALPEGADVAMVVLFVEFPGFGMNPIALRVVTDSSVERVRLFIAPTLWTAGRELVAVVAATTQQRMLDGLIALDRVAVVVDGNEVAPPPFATREQAIVERTSITLPARSSGLLMMQGTGFRVYAADDVDTVDLAPLGLDASIERVWSIGGAATSTIFDSGSFALTRAMRRPSSARALFSAQ